MEYCIVLNQLVHFPAAIEACLVVVLAQVGSGFRIWEFGRGMGFQRLSWDFLACRRPCIFLVRA